MSYEVNFSNSECLLLLQCTSHTVIHWATLHFTPPALCLTAACKALLKATLLNLYHCFLCEKGRQARQSVQLWQLLLHALLSGEVYSWGTEFAEGKELENSQIMITGKNKKFSHSPFIWWAGSFGGICHFNWFLTQCRKKDADILKNAGFSSSPFWGGHLGAMHWAFHGKAYVIGELCVLSIGKHCGIVYSEKQDKASV